MASSILARLRGSSGFNDRSLFKTQIAMTFAFCVVLELAYHAEREWRRIANEHHLHVILPGGDGLAWYIWLAAVPFIMWMIRRFPMDNGRALSSLLKIAAGSLGVYFVVATLRFALRVTANIWLPPADDITVNFEAYFNNLLVLLPLDLLTYCGFFTMSFAVDLYFKFRRRSEEAANLQLQMATLQSELAQAELAALRGQLHPHFLFNSFNAVASLVRQGKSGAAVEVIAQFSALLRRIMDSSRPPKVPLSEEIDFVRTYLEIESVRFGKRLRYKIDVEAGAAEVLVPNLVLQPLVENAIKHGISQRSEPGTVWIAATHEGTRLCVDIANDGPQPGSPAETPLGPPRTGIGLANTRARLERIYRGDYRLELVTRADRGAFVRLEVPWRPVLSSAEPLPL